MKQQITSNIRKFAVPFITAALSIGICLAGVSQAQTEDPIRYTIKKGDTLWDISARFLEKPWLWPELWQQNDYIENPHLIFPDDVLLISSSSIRLIRNTKMQNVKLSPKIRETSIHEAITTIDPSAIIPFLSQSIIIEEDELESAAHVLRGTNDEIVLGKNSRFYAAGLSDSDATKYQIFRIGRKITDLSGNVSYGFEGVHLGTASLLERHDEASVFEVDSANQEIRPGDRLVAVEKPTALPRYFPRRPDTPIDSRVLMIPKGVNEAARRDIVIVSGGSAEQLQAGHVLEVFSNKGAMKDPVTGQSIKLPDLKVGTAMVFKTYEHISYAILMESTAAIKIGDRASSP